MNRILLALLALFAGLAAQAAPAQARIGGGDTEIGSVESTRGSARGQAAQSASVDAPAARHDRRERDGARVRTSRPTVYIPSVLFGADRAFE